MSYGRMFHVEHFVVDRLCVGMFHVEHWREELQNESIAPMTQFGMSELWRSPWDVLWFRDGRGVVLGRFVPLSG